ncbi:MAG: hypothetical protein QOC80_623, partial [Frankiaceae bacterium]|nr:hypothetical protein [Frankiaceae bacterium]
LRLVYPDKVLAREIAEAEQAATGVVPAYRVMVLVDDPAGAVAMVDLATDLISTVSPSQVVLTTFPQQESGALEIGAGLSGELARMATTLGELETLAARVRARGGDVAVLTRFSADPPSDLLDQVGSVGVDVLLLPADSPVASDQRLADVPVTVGVWEGGAVLPEGPLAVYARAGQSGDSALALAVRWSRTRRTPLSVRDDGRRRVPGLIDRLQKAGIDAVTTEAAAGVAVVAADGRAAADATAVLRVRASSQQDDSELVLLLDALPTQSRREAAVTSTVAGDKAVPSA